MVAESQYEVRILVCVKQVPVSSSVLTISESGTTINTEGLVYEPNENDLYAVEEAVYQKSLHGGQVTAITVGPPSAKNVLYSVYARGADRAIHIIDEKFEGNNQLFNLAAISDAAKSDVPGFDLILTGVRADDDLMGQFGVSLSEALGIPMITSISRHDISPHEKTATVQREIGNGYRQEIEVDLPCVLSIQFGIRPLQYTSINQLIKAKMRRIQSLNFESVAGHSEDDVFSTTLSAPQSSDECQMITGTPAEVAAKLTASMARQQ